MRVEYCLSVVLTYLHQKAMDIFQHCLRKLVPKWIPRSQNTKADNLSKLIETDNWSIEDKGFRKINARFGLFSIDRFSDEHNKKLSRFNSKFCRPATEGVNSFYFRWYGENNWLCPPISLIVIRILVNVVVHYWFLFGNQHPTGH